MPPDFRDSDSPGNVSLVLSQSTSLVCDVTGSPTPVITWYKNGTPVSSLKLNKTQFYVYIYICIEYAFFVTLNKLCFL